jgi:hypothetical protein
MKAKLNYAMKKFCTKNVPNKIVSLLLLTPMLLLSAGCHREQVQVYQVASEPDQTTQLETQAQPAAQSPAASQTQPAAPAQPADMSQAALPATTSEAPPVSWTTPAGWTEVPPSEIRVGSFKISGADGKQADVSVVPLPGMAGGNPANVNRWRGQVNLPALSDDQLASQAEDVQAGGQSAELYDLAGQNATTGQATRILGVIQHRDGTAWFFKMTGDANLVEQEKPTFITFLQSLNFAPQPAQAQLPPGHPDIGNDATTIAVPASHEGQPNWQVPSGWQEVNAGQFLVAKFMISGQNGATAAVNVSSSSGDGGGLAPNVNRWRGQLGLQPEDEIATVTFAVPNGQGQLVDFTGNNAQTGHAAELVGIMVTQPGQTWFYKLMGDPGVVAAQKDAFTQFVKDVKY